MELPSNPDTLCVVRNALGPLAQALGFSDAECRAVVLAVDEALTNIIRHAYQGKADEPIEISFRRIHSPQDGAGRTALEIVFEDHGAKVDAKKLCSRDLEDVRPGGLGLHFIKESMDAVEFRRHWGRNQLRLVKFLHSSEPSKGQ
jgi:anti-sigma regulatory factor (Ser/Thr protein kinase)